MTPATPIANVILYNAEALVVFDRNGGRITHLFSLVDGEPLCVSGTFKCYQYTSADGTICDGPVVQNTVFTAFDGLPRSHSAMPVRADFLRQVRFPVGTGSFASEAMILRQSTSGNPAFTPRTITSTAFGNSLVKSLKRAVRRRLT